MQKCISYITAQYIHSYRELVMLFFKFFFLRQSYPELKKKKKQKNFSSALAKTFDLVLIICEKLHSKDLNSIGCCIIGG